MFGTFFWAGFLMGVVCSRCVIYLCKSLELPLTEDHHRSWQGHWSHHLQTEDTGMVDQQTLGYFGLPRQILYHSTADCTSGFPCILWSPGIFFLENSRTWKVIKNHFGPGKSCKLMLKILESSGKISLKVRHHFPSGSFGTQAAIVYHSVCVDLLIIKCSVECLWI